MGRSFETINITEALKTRIQPAITVWNRLEGRPRTRNFNRSLKAEVRDALWFLTRQWQMAEFQGDDAGSPVFAKIHLDSSTLTKYRPGKLATEPFRTEEPLEAKVERRPVPLIQAGREIAFDIRLLMGRHWLKLIAGIGNYRQAYLDKYPISHPDPKLKANADVCAHPEVWQTMEAIAGRHMDGTELYLYLKANPANHAYDGIAVADADKVSLDEKAKRFIIWFEQLFYQPTNTDAWDASRLEYQFACSASTPEGEQVYVAEEYYHGHLDWYNLDMDSQSAGLGPVPGLPANTTQGITRTMIPTPVQFEGMPNTRWWELEDRKTNFGDVTASTTDLAKLMFLEFGLIYANDWFVIPCTLPAGSITQIRGLAVTNVFGERIWIEAAGRGLDDDWQRWSMFTVNKKGQAVEKADTNLLLLPTLPKIEESPPTEEVLFFRDEMANMVWGIEKTITLADGSPKYGAEAGREFYQFFQKELQERLQLNPPPPFEYKAKIRYQVMTSVAENWIPFIPVHVDGSNREVQLQRAAMPRILEGDPDKPVKVRPRTSLLRPGADVQPPQKYLVHEEEVPRAGVRLIQTFQRARWRNGQVVLWLGIRKQAGRGESSSGLAFDQILDVPANK